MTSEQHTHRLLCEALALYDNGELQNAERLCAEAISMDGDDPAALHLAGIIAQDRGDSQRALEFLAAAVRNAPDDADAWNDFGNVLQCCGQIQEAMEAFGQAMRLAPQFADAHSNFGYMLLRQSAFEESLEHFRNAIDIEPTFTLAYNNLGSAFLEMGRYDEAIAAFRQAVDSDPDCADGYVNLGNALRRSERHVESIEVLRHGYQRAPSPELLLNLGCTLKDFGRLDAARDCYEQALAMRPTYAEAHCNLALLLLAEGELERGWEEFEWRRQVKAVAPDVWPRNSVEWTGQIVAGKKLLLVAEQGLGDTLHLIRYAKVLKDHGATVIAAVQPGLLKILENCEAVDELVPLRPQFPAHDYFCFLMSLPRLLSPTLDSIPNCIPYLFASNDLRARWSATLKSLDGFKVGIGWQGNPNYAGDRSRSIPLDYFLPLAKIPGVRLINLQSGFGREQLALVRDGAITDFGPDLDTLSGAFMDTAAIMQNLNLVISSDTALVHLAGALGVPVWMPTSYVPDWRWLLQRTDSPWYPTLRLFRQPQRSDWKAVFAEIAEQLVKLAGA